MDAVDLLSTALMLLKLLTPLVLLPRTVNGAADGGSARNWRWCCLVRELVRKATHSENQMNQNHRRQRPNHARHA